MQIFSKIIVNPKLAVKKKQKEKFQNKIFIGKGRWVN